MINQVVLVGRVVKELDLKYTNQGRQWHASTWRSIGISKTQTVTRLIFQIARCGGRRPK